MSYKKLLFSLLLSTTIVITSCFSRPYQEIVEVPSNNLFTSVKVYISNEFSESERINIIKGVELWSAATNGLVAVEFVSLEQKKIDSFYHEYKNTSQQRSVLYIKASSTDTWVIEWDKNRDGKVLLGYCQGDSAIEIARLWLVEDRLLNQTSQITIAAHELGHALGLHHINHKSAIMNATPNLSLSCITQEDLEEFCNRYFCNQKQLTSICKNT